MCVSKWHQDSSPVCNNYLVNIPHHPAPKDFVAQLTEHIIQELWRCGFDSHPCPGMFMDVPGLVYKCYIGLIKAQLH